jgi:hypothetical protein
MGILQMMGISGSPLTINISAVWVEIRRKTACGNPTALEITPTPGTDVQGGSGNYTYQWERTSSPATHGPWICSDPTIANPTWSAPDIICLTDNPSEIWQLTVIDNSTGQVGSVRIHVVIEFFQNPFE